MYSSLDKNHQETSSGGNELKNNLNSKAENSIRTEKNLKIINSSSNSSSTTNNLNYNNFNSNTNSITSNSFNQDNSLHIKNPENGVNLLDTSTGEINGPWMNGSLSSSTPNPSPRKNSADGFSFNPRSGIVSTVSELETLEKESTAGGSGSGSGSPLAFDGSTFVRPNRKERKGLYFTNIKDNSAQEPCNNKETNLIASSSPFSPTKPNNSSVSEGPEVRDQIPLEITPTVGEASVSGLENPAHLPDTYFIKGDERKSGMSILNDFSNSFTPKDRGTTTLKKTDGIMTPNSDGPHTYTSRASFNGMDGSSCTLVDLDGKNITANTILKSGNSTTGSGSSDNSTSSSNSSSTSGKSLKPNVIPGLKFGSPTSANSTSTDEDTLELEDDRQAAVEESQGGFTRSSDKNSIVEKKSIVEQDSNNRGGAHENSLLTKDEDFDFNNGGKSKVEMPASASSGRRVDHDKSDDAFITTNGHHGGRVNFIGEGTTTDGYGGLSLNLNKSSSNNGGGSGGIKGSMLVNGSDNDDNSIESRVRALAANNAANATTTVTKGVLNSNSSSSFNGKDLNLSKESGSNSCLSLSVEENFDGIGEGSESFSVLDGSIATTEDSSLLNFGDLNESDLQQSSPPGDGNPPSLSRQGWQRTSLRRTTPNNLNGEGMNQRRWGSFRNSTKRGVPVVPSSKALANELYRSSSYHSSGRSSAGDGEEMYSDSSLEGEVIDLNKKFHHLEEKFTVLAENQNDVDDRYTRAKQENVELSTKLFMLEEQLRDVEQRADDKVREEQRRQKDILVRLEREKQLQVENYEIKAQMLEKELSSSKLDVKRLEGSLERERNEKNRLGDKCLNFEREVATLRDHNRELLNQNRVDREAMARESEGSQQAMIELKRQIDSLSQFHLSPSSSSHSFRRIDSSESECSELKSRLREAEEDIKRLKKQNTQLQETNEELSAQILNQGLENGRNLLRNLNSSTVSDGHSLAAEFEAMSMEETDEYGFTSQSRYEAEEFDKVKSALKDQKEANIALRDYIDGILLNIVEHYPQLLEVKRKSNSNGFASQ